MTKEDIYDTQIFPLMARVIEICKEQKLAMLATFAIPNDEDPDLVCMTALLSDEYAPPEGFLDALRTLKGQPTTVMAFTITHAPKSEGR